MKMPLRSLETLLLVLVPAVCMAHGTASGEKTMDASQPQVLAPGWSGELAYPPPEPGSYKLPRIKRAADGEVLLDDGRAARLHDYMGDRNVLLSFVYTHCSDANGCPLATFVLHTIKSKLKEHPEVAKHLRMISLSFDPVNDTPEAMREYGGEFSGSGVEWQFMTTRSTRELAPVLNGYGQYVIPEVNEKGEETGQFAHILKVYLIDKEGWVRNIYSVSFLHADVLLADVRTLMLDEREERARW